MDKMDLLQNEQQPFNTFLAARLACFAQGGCRRSRNPANYRIVVAFQLPHESESYVLR